MQVKKHLKWGYKYLSVILLITEVMGFGVLWCFTRTKYEILYLVSCILFTLFCLLLVGQHEFRELKELTIQMKNVQTKHGRLLRSALASFTRDTRNLEKKVSNLERRKNAE